MTECVHELDAGCYLGVCVAIEDGVIPEWLLEYFYWRVDWFPVCVDVLAV